MSNTATIVISILSAVFASTGFWSFATIVWQKKFSKVSAESKMILGLGHDRIVYLGMSYIERGYITNDEYENLYNYLYLPYKALGGNGSAERIMNEVMKLEIRKSYKEED